MKKSSTLMLSYIIFLVLTVIIKFRFEWGGLGQVALAATIAGCFFAFADLANWYISYRKPLVEAMEEDIVIFKQYSDTVIEYIRRDIENSKQAIELVAIYADEDCRIKEFISACETSAPHFQQMIKDIEGYQSEMDEIEIALNKATKKLFGISILDVIFATCGFVIFFILLCFNSIVELVVPYGEPVTVLAFAIIMLNYFLRDILEDHAKKDLADITEHMQQEKANIEEIKTKMEESNYIDIAKRIVEFIETRKNMEDNTDG